ncbi:hypothetical protein ACS0TY_008459 [Phlomoides rotata]
MGKLVSQVSVKTEQDVFQVFMFPNCIPQITPDKVQSVDLLEGRWGTLGSIVTWYYIEGGENKINKVRIESVDEKKKSITFKSIGGNMLESYNPFIVKVDIRTNGQQNLITWTMEYEKKSEAAPEPRAFMNYLLDFSRQLHSNPQLVAN